MEILTETYRNTEVDVPKVPTVIEEYKKYAEELGFYRMSLQVDQRIRSDVVSKICLPLTRSQIASMCTKYPTVYDVTSVDSRHTKLYKYDTIPLGVLKEIEYARNSGWFDKIYIRTPEVRDPDPVLEGIIGEDHFLLARWGTALVSLEELWAPITKPWAETHSIIITLFFVACFITVLFIAFGLHEPLLLIVNAFLLIILIMRAVMFHGF